MLRFILEASLTFVRCFVQYVNVICEFQAQVLYLCMYIFGFAMVAF